MTEGKNNGKEWGIKTEISKKVIVNMKTERQKKSRKS